MYDKEYEKRLLKALETLPLFDWHRIITETLEDLCMIGKISDKEYENLLLSLFDL